VRVNVVVAAMVRREVNVSYVRDRAHRRGDGGGDVHTVVLLFGWLCEV